MLGRFGPLLQGLLLVGQAPCRFTRFADMSRRMAALPLHRKLRLQKGMNAAVRAVATAAGALEPVVEGAWCRKPEANILQMTSQRVTGTMPSC